MRVFFFFFCSNDVIDKLFKMYFYRGHSNYIITRHTLFKLKKSVVDFNIVLS